MKKPLLGSHQRSWIWGRNLIVETLRAGRWRPYELRLAPEVEAELRDLAEAREVPVHVETPSRLTQLCGASDHQGVIAKMPPFPYAAIDEVLGRIDDRRGQKQTAGAPLFVMTDHLQDPYNFGAIVRSAECFGAAGVFVPSDRQVGVTSQVARSSAGAVNHLPIARADDLLSLADRLHQHEVKLVAASEHASIPLHEANLAGPIAIVIGNEGVGIDPALLARCDLAAKIPITGTVGSLNAAVAAGIMLYEARRQRESTPDC